MPAGDPTRDLIQGFTDGEDWMRIGGRYVPLTVEVGVYGPFAREQPHGQPGSVITVPAGTPQAGVLSVVLTGPGGWTPLSP